MLRKIGKMLKNKKGFSLIELIVVIAILGVIVGLAAPNIVGAIVNARINADRTNAAQIANAMQRVLAEGGTLEKTTGDQKTDLDEDADIITPPGENKLESLTPRYIQSIPQSQLNRANFKYTYDGNSIKIYAQNRETTPKYVEIWPDFNEENYK